MVKIRLSRQGSRGKVFYRIVATEEKQKLSGGFLEILGYWHPAKSVVEIKKERVDYWTKKGAIVSPAVTKLIK